ncbi:MAG: HAD family hydrolase [Chloroflexota bacterium]|nr:HAD family hydrolase [Chloroflexota bacterium]
MFDENIAAFFDMDKTVLSKSSGVLYTRHMFRAGQLSWNDMLLVFWSVIKYKLALVDWPRVVQHFLEQARGQREKDLLEETLSWFHKLIVPHIAPLAVERMAWHRGHGHHVALLSASTPYIVGVLADYLGLADNYICSRLEVINGVFTGRMVEPLCYAAGKVYWAEVYARERGVNLDSSYFYTDSISDIPMLQRVGCPVAVNPDFRLRRHARRHGWPVEAFY